MPMPRCPRCQGLLLHTVQEDKPNFCVNCAGRFDYVELMPRETMTPERKRRGTRTIKKQKVLSRST